MKTSSITEERNIKVEWSKEEKKDIPPLYGCEILIEKATLEQLKDPSFPSDAYIVTYKVGEEKHMDLCRGNRVRIFDLYYDKFGSGSIQSIDWGYGRVNPKLWGYKSTTKSKKRK